MSQRYLGGIITANPTAPTLSSASGVWTLEQDFQNSASITPQVIGRSVRLRSSASAYFNRTPASASNRNTWTWSAWVKRGILGSGQTVFAAYPSSTVYAYIGFTSSDQIRYASTNSGASLTTTAVYRDPSAWYHIVFVYDDTQATSSNRLKLYVNGVQVTAFGTASYPTLNFGDYINSANVHNLGRFPSGTEYTDGYLTEINFIDGQALTPSSFGAYDSNGIWQPLSYRGTYGTNGFYLNFSDNSAATATTIGKDYSGNGNNWTPNNISVTAGVTYDSMIDSPTNSPDGGNGRGNYCVLNPLDKGGDVTVADGGLTMYTPFASGSSFVVRSSIAIPTTGKWYWEAASAALNGNTANNAIFGVIAQSSALTSYLGSSSTGYGYYANNGNKYNSGSATAYGATYTSTDIIGIAFDADAGTLTFYKNNTSQGTAFSGLTGTTYFAAIGNGSSGAYINFGQRPFAYTPPTGFKALNTQNLPAVTINNGAQYMAATLWTGTGASTVTVNNGANNPIGTTFQPDFIWAKQRNIAQNHTLADSVRGTGYLLFTDTTSADYTPTTYGQVTAFNSNGFTGSLGSNVTNSFFSQNTGTYVGWQWKAGGTAVSNTSGSITSSVSANTAAGFSVVTGTSDGANPFTVGHGLGVTPNMIIFKLRNGVDGWYVAHSGLTNMSSYWLVMNSTAAVASGTAIWGTGPTSTVFGVRGSSIAGSGQTFVAYCFAAVKGYSAFGSYTGNGSADGPFVYCGFRPRWVMIKRTDVNGASWWIQDTSRSTYNAANAILFPNLSNAEYTTAGVELDVLSNGFKWRTSNVDGNASGGTYIYACFAENPFNISRAR